MKTELNNRILWFDGTNQVNPEDVPSLLLSGVPIDKIAVNNDNEDIKLFNLLEEISIKAGKAENEPFDLEWNIPEKYKKIDLNFYLIDSVKDRSEEYFIRASDEMVEIRKRKLEPLFQTLIFVIDKFKEENVVWGVGRGSSCACLILFLMGVHLIDPVKYKIPMHEFFHD